MYDEPRIIFPLRTELPTSLLKQDDLDTAMLWEGQPDKQLIKYSIREATYVPAKKADIRTLDQRSAAPGILCRCWLPRSTLHAGQLLKTHSASSVSGTSLRLRTHQRALVGSFPSMCENWLGSNVWSPTRLRCLLQRPIWIHACVSSSCRCGIGSNPRTHSRHDTEQCHANHDEPEAHCPKGNAPSSPATLGFGTEATPTVVFRSWQLHSGGVKRITGGRSPGPVLSTATFPMQPDKTKACTPDQAQHA